jgi:[ribosomal protein S5]-alanine N-acetyltransferase
MTSARITNAVPHIFTERTIVRLGERSDRDSVLAFYTNNKDRLSPLSPTWPEGFFTKPFWDRQLDRNLEEFYADFSARMFVFLRTQPHDCIGNISLSGILRNAAQFCYLGYGIDSNWEGKGLMRESVAAVVRYAFQDLNLHRVMANYLPHNTRSGKLLESLGFTIEGQAKNYLYLDGSWRDHVLTSITNHNWQA